MKLPTLAIWILSGATALVVPPACGADIVVSAASSLTNAFSEIGKAFEKTKPEHKVLFSFGASGSLLQQISRGAPVDVFASADQETMDRAQKQNLIVVETRRNFASNKLVVVVPAGAKANLVELNELASTSIQRIAIGNPESVPVGRYAKAALEAINAWERLLPKMIFTQNVRQGLDYVARGEVDAGFVYLSDVSAGNPKVKTALQVPTAKPILYPMAVVKGNGQENLARTFVQFVYSETGQKILANHGFLSP